MVSKAIYDGNESVFEKTAANYFYFQKEAEKSKSYSYINNTLFQTGEKKQYTQYWHGYLVLLKPLLLVFDYKNIRLSNYLIQTILLCVLSGLITKKCGWAVTIESGIVSTLLMVPGMALCMLYACDFYVLLAACFFCFPSGRGTLVIFLFT